MTDDGVFEDRTTECQAALAELDADAVVLSPGPNLYYLTGFWTHPEERHLLCFVTPDDAAFVVPELYEAQIRGASWVEDLRTWADDDDPTGLVEETIADLTIPADGQVLVDDRMWAQFTLDLRATLPEAEFGLASEVLTDLRIRKDEAELKRLREVAAITDEVSRRIRAMGGDAIGLTERELAAEIRTRLEERGGEEPSFETIVGSGPNGAMPHHTHGDRTIERGDPVVLDFGAWMDRYPSDQTRTVVFAGDPPPGFEDAFAAVREAQAAGVAAVEPGVEAGAVDRAAREVIEERGYGEQFIHRTGHGVGLDVHEPPYIVADSDRRLEPGMVFSVEPGVYLDGEFGIRIEDLVVVTETGVERLNDSPRGWEPL